MAKTLSIKQELLKEGDRPVVAAMQAALAGQAPEVQYKSLLPFIRATYGDKVKEIITLTGDSGGIGGAAAKILSALSLEKIQNSLTPVQVQIAAVEKELDAQATLEIGLFDERLDGRWISDETGKYTHRQLRVPVSMMGAVSDLIAQSETLNKTLWEQFVTLLRGEKVIAADKEPRGGKLVFRNGKFTWEVPVRKPRGPKDPNAPKAAPRNTGQLYAFGQVEGQKGLVAGEPQGAKVIGTGIPSVTKLANAMAVFANKNGLPGFTPRDETQENLNWPSVYSKKAEKAGFVWWKVTPQPTNGEKPAPQAN